MGVQEQVDLLSSGGIRRSGGLHCGAQAGGGAGRHARDRRGRAVWHLPQTSRVCQEPRRRLPVHAFPAACLGRRRGGTSGARGAARVPGSHQARGGELRVLRGVAPSGPDGVNALALLRKRMGQKWAGRRADQEEEDEEEDERAVEGAVGKRTCRSVRADGQVWMPSRLAGESHRDVDDELHVLVVVVVLASGDLRRLARSEPYFPSTMNFDNLLNRVFL